MSETRELLKQNLNDYRNGVTIDVTQVMKLINQAETPVAYYYCREFYCEGEDIRKAIENDRELMKKLRKWRDANIGGKNE